jgi:hypothetical protein
MRRRHQNKEPRRSPERASVVRVDIEHIQECMAARDTNPEEEIFGCWDADTMNEARGS